MSISYYVTLRGVSLRSDASFAGASIKMVESRKIYN